jgi:HEAT repeat protein
LPAFVAKLSDRKQDTRNNAISGIGCLRCEDALENLLPMIKQGSDQDRAQVVRQIAGLAYETLHNTSQNPIAWTTEGRRFWRDTMMEALQDSASEVRQQAAFALENFGDSDTLPALEAARRGETDDNAAYYIDRAIAVLKDS